MVDGGVADLQLDHETTETTRSLGSKSNTQILGLTRDTQIKGIGVRISFLICEHRGRNSAFGYSLNLKQSAKLR